MPEVGCDLADVDACFEKVGGVGVTQGVDDELGVFLVKATLGFGDTPGGPG